MMSRFNSVNSIRSAVARPKWSAFVLVLVCHVGLVSERACFANEPYEAAVVEPSIQSLLDQLDARSFQARQAAAAQLVELGEEALKPMALHAFDATPESAWRIRTVLEGIGTAGSENTFYKSTGVLRLLFPLSDDATLERIDVLRQKWIEARKREAVAHLEELGARINDPLRANVANANERQRWIMANGGRVVFGDNVLANQQVVTASTGVKNRKKAKRQPALSRAELAASVETILSSDVETNREHLFGVDADAESPNQSYVTNPAADAQIRRAAVNRYRLGVTVSLADDFRGSVSDLARLKQIPNVTEVQWKDRSLTLDQLKTLNEIASVRRVSFDNCTLPTGLTHESWPRWATHFVFRNQAVSKQTIELLEDSVVASLTLANCQLDDGVLAQLQDIASLIELNLEDFQIDAEWFKTFRSLGSLKQLQLSLCKFETKAYRELKKARKDLRIEFTPQAFLGIRSMDQFDPEVRRAQALARARAAARRANPGQPLPPAAIELAQPKSKGSKGCKISEVVAESGAAAGGMLAGDVVTKINDEPITVFEDIRLVVAQHRAGEVLRVSVLRDGKPQTLKIKLSRFPQNAGR